MNGTLRPDLGNVVMIGGIAFLMIFLIDRGLRLAGRPTWTSSGG